MILILATENRDKGREIEAILKEQLDIDVRLLPKNITLPPETGVTYRDNAIVKAVYAAKTCREWALGDDSGLEIDALNGAPGLFSARFAGENVTYADNRKKVLDALGNLSDEKRSARFVCTMAIADPTGNVAVVEGRCEGRITHKEVGRSGFGYDPIFFVPEYGKTFAELSSTEKSRMSHRGVAVRAAMELLIRHEQKRAGRSGGSH